MTTLNGRPKTALLVIDVQNDVVRHGYDRDRIVANVCTLVSKARTAGAGVIWVQHTSDELAPGSEGWNYIPQLERSEIEPLVNKRYGDAFEDTDLECVLDAGGVGHLVVAGAQTDACVRSTVHGAFARGYDVTLVSDAHTTEDLSSCGAPSPEKVIDHTNLYWQFQTAPGRKAAVVATADVVFR